MASSGSRAGMMPRAGALLLALAAVLLAAEWAHASYIDPASATLYNRFIKKMTNIMSTGDDDVEVNLSDYGEDPADLQLLQDVGK
ncbi:hypothetical protein HW555_012314 [Spodoptera exigua]|uniref:Uncharacterized protein n=1 Tax=Spodoptera exigua TaxID=7107 RepID=A0A835G7A9_SPOEX|nr:hypothetical protein HW555_012314 [Spodoptera exigua]